MKNFVLYTVLLVAPFLFTSSQNPSLSKDLSDELVGVYTGMFAKDGNLKKSFQVKVTKVDASTIKVTPFDTENGKPFKATVKEDNLSALRIIRLESADDIIVQNGMMTPVNGRLSYGISTEGKGQLEVFSGLKK